MDNIELRYLILTMNEKDKFMKLLVIYLLSINSLLIINKSLVYLIVTITLLIKVLIEEESTQEIIP